MKKLLLTITAIAFCVLFTGCSKDDDNDSKPQYSIIGVWKWAKSEWIYEFKQGGVCVVYTSGGYENNDPLYDTTYTYDGTYLTLKGGEMQEVIFSNEGKTMLWGVETYHKIK